MRQLALTPYVLRFTFYGSVTYIGALLLFLAGLVQSVVLPQAVPLQARPQFVVLLVIAVCLVESLYDAAICAFIGGSRDAPSEYYYYFGRRHGVRRCEFQWIPTP